jgi:RHS repeat-associated protein
MRALVVALAASLLSLQATAETLYFIHVDHLGTPRLAIGEDDVERWRWEQLEPFGENPPIEVMGPEGYPVNLPLRFPGQYADKETNRHYNYYRDYDPGTGRYVQSDPIGLRGGLNTYGYVGNDPIARVDPAGLTDTTLVPPSAIPSVTTLCLANPAACGVGLAGAGGYAVGTLIYPIIEPVLSPVVDACLRGVDDEKERCREILKACREKCLDIFVNNPNGLPGSGTDYAGRQRRCIRECMEEKGCYDF